MKRISAFLATLILLLCFTSCGNQPAGKNTPSTVSPIKDTAASQNTEAEEGENTDMNHEQDTESSEQTNPNPDNNILVAYFSCTNTTKGIAEIIADETGGTLYEIVPADPYTEDDLKYYTNGRADREQEDPSCRPEILGLVSDMSAYDTVFIGYPIWHGQAPRIISTFLESYDFSGKTIIPFCTSHSSGIGSSDSDLHFLASDSAVWMDGKRFSGSSDKSEITEWIKMLNLDTQQPAAANSDVSSFDLASGKNGSAPTVMLNSGYEMPILGLGTYSLHGDTVKNSVKAALNHGVRLIDTAYMYGNEKEIGEAIRESSVPREDIFVITKIYLGEQFENPEKAIQDALDTLDIDYIDMMLLPIPVRTM